LGDGKSELIRTKAHKARSETERAGTNGQEKASFGTKTLRRNSHGQKQSAMHGVNAIACSALGMVCWVLNLPDAEFV
jgi:hypothetical protein